jgi:hypothetical protein
LTQPSSESDCSTVIGGVVSRSFHLLLRYLSSTTAWPGGQRNEPALSIPVDAQPVS